MKPSLWFRLFGEWKIFFWLIGGVLALTIAGYAAFGYVVVHFLRKFW